MSHPIEIYTDGSALGNPGPAGWAYLIWNKKDNIVEEGGGNELHATNNQMELAALQHVLKKINTWKDSKDIIIHLDSEYVKNGITVWIHNWKKNNWRTAAKKPVLNKELWEAIDGLFIQAKTKHNIELRYVPGHAGVAGNEVVDSIARTLAAQETWELFSGSRDDFESLRNVKF